MEKYLFELREDVRIAREESQKLAEAVVGYKRCIGNLQEEINRLNDLTMRLYTENQKLQSENAKLKVGYDEVKDELEELKDDFYHRENELLEEIETLNENLSEAAPIGYRGFGGFDFFR